MINMQFGDINMKLASKILYVIAMIGLLGYCIWLKSQPNQLDPKAEQILLQQYQDFQNWQKN